MTKEVVYRPWSQRKLKSIVGHFPKDVRSKQKWLKEWNSVCRIYSPHMPAMMQLLKLTMPSDLKDKVIDAYEIPRNPTEWSRITPEKAQMLYSIIALAVQWEVTQQIDFTPLTKMSHENCFSCGEPGHCVRACPNKAAPCTLPKAPPSSNQNRRPTDPTV